MCEISHGVNRHRVIFHIIFSDGFSIPISQGARIGISAGIFPGLDELAAALAGSRLGGWFPQPPEKAQEPHQ
jgi:hypothetical protein